MRSAGRWAGSGVALCVVWLGASETSAQQCGGSSPVGNLGVTLVECDCIIAPVTSATPWRFFTEPRVLRIEPGSPADGQLRAGDVIARVDGQAVTSVAGARLLSALRPNEAVALTIRRNGQLLNVPVRPSGVCPSDPSLLGSVPAVQRVQVGASGSWSYEAATLVPATEVQLAPARAAWVGIAFSCGDCGFRRDDRGGLWHFASAPEVYSVEPGSPAYRAGLRRGDVLTHIDDQPIASDAAGRRWAQLAPEEVVRLRYSRGSATRYANVRAGTPPGVASLAAMRAVATAQQLRALESSLAARDSVLRQYVPAAVERLRYSGSIGGADVEVRSASPITVSETADELVIRVGDTLVRVRRGRVTR